MSNITGPIRDVPFGVVIIYPQQELGRFIKPDMGRPIAGFQRERRGRKVHHFVFGIQPRIRPCTRRTQDMRRVLRQRTGIKRGLFVRPQHPPAHNPQIGAIVVADVFDGGAQRGNRHGLRDSP
jgi:hypothetical protein